MAPSAAALPRTSCFVEDTPQNNFGPYDTACRQFAEAIETEAHLNKVNARVGGQVMVHVYELAAFGGMNRLTASEHYPIGGALHVGIEVYGREWSYGGGSGPGAGVICEFPRSNTKHLFRESLDLGRTKLCDGEVALIIGELLESWHPKDYHWLHKNCLAFANELCDRLGVQRIPPWIDRFARGAGAVDMGVRGLAGGFVERFQDVAEGARDVMRAIVDGPASCGQFHCSSAAKLRCYEEGCERLCTSRKPTNMVEAALPASKSIFEVEHDPDARIVYDTSSFAAKAPSVCSLTEEDGFGAGARDTDEVIAMGIARWQRYRCK